MHAALNFLMLHWKSLLGWVWLLTGIYLAIRIVWQQRSPAATLAWILALCLIPPVGLVLYHFVGPRRIQRQSLRRMRSRALLASETDLEALRANNPHPPVWATQHSRLIEASSGIPAASCSKVERLLGGAATLRSILQAVQCACQHIHLEYYIFEPDQTGQRLLAALTERARQGVKVRLLVDGVGSSALLGWRGRTMLQAYRQAGGEFAIFHPARLDRWRPLVNLRTHRKIVVVDGSIGFTGGINITDEENEELFPDVAYRDTHLRMEGAGVRWLQYVFMQDWVYASGKHRFEPEVLAPHAPGPYAVHVVASGPDSDGQSIHQSMLHAISIAEQRILLTTPYFVPTEPTFFALMNAALRGVNVQILVPRRSDSWLVTVAARSYFGVLRGAGVKIFEYQGNMLHAKTLVVDDNYSMVGTANFDNRSFLLNFEIAVALFSPELNRQLAEDFVHDLGKARLVTFNPRSIRWYYHLPASFARLLSPLL
ncbi:MAG: cardiolipin synthase [Brachymonas denitrificans]|uniref:cardiolipin synthase n=1 Tax=Brachymonas denitrificans TaxID=28220 RepID=UPI00202002B7|nr:cardiolipin synthase [Brachymonas denitrificans]